MKTQAIFFRGLILAVLSLVAGGCTGADMWDSVPANIKTFIDYYYPNSELAEYSKDKSGSIVVELKDGPGFTFDRSGIWSDISGNGLPIKEILIYDQTPEPLYTYLEGIEAASGVFEMSRDAKEYHLTLLDSSLTYSIDTGAVESSRRE
ncbi:MAG: hypothetical protein K2M06_02460 [Muribaculaceae bacterium]|nr:hypothetical protein [Muribaculaceae bacterium]